jgi:hypothetical protein
MRPNEFGGQTLENHYEIQATAAALSANHQEELASWLTIAPSSQNAKGNIHPDLLNQPERVLELNSNDTKLAISSLRKAASARTWVTKGDMWMAQSMLARLDGDSFVPKSHQVRRTFIRLRNSIGER